MENFNSHKYLTDTKNRLLTILRGIKPTSLGIQTGQPGTNQTPAILPQAPEKEVSPDERNVKDQSLGVSKQSNMFDVKKFVIFQLWYNTTYMYAT